MSVNERLPTPAGSPETPTTFRVSLGRSGSVSLARTLMVTAAWSVVAAMSSLATGGSLTAVTVIDTVATLLSSVPSFTL